MDITWLLTHWSKWNVKYKILMMVKLSGKAILNRSLDPSMKVVVTNVKHGIWLHGWMLCNINSAGSSTCLFRHIYWTPLVTSKGLISFKSRKAEKNAVKIRLVYAETSCSLFVVPWISVTYILGLYS